MFKKSKKVLAVTVALVFVTGIAVYAQVYRSSQTPQQRVVGQQRAIGQMPNAVGPMQNQQRVQNQAGPQGRGGGLNPGDRGKAIGGFANLTRILLPLSPRELQKIGLVLNLTDEQKGQIKTLYKQFQDKTKPLLEGRGAEVKGVIDALQQPSPSKGQLQSAANQVFQTDNSIVDAEFDFWIGLEGILNADQQQAMGQMIQQRLMNEMGGGRQMQPGQGQQPRNGTPAPIQQ